MAPALNSLLGLRTQQCFQDAAARNSAAQQFSGLLVSPVRAQQPRASSRDGRSGESQAEGVSFYLHLSFNVGGITVTSYMTKHKDTRRSHVPPNSPVNSAVTEPFGSKAGFELLAVGNQKLQVEDSAKQQVSRFPAFLRMIEGSQFRRQHLCLPADYLLNTCTEHGIVWSGSKNVREEVIKKLVLLHQSQPAPPSPHHPVT